MQTNLQKLFKLLLFYFFFTQISYSQNAWLKIFGGDNCDYLNEIHETPDGGYIAAGSTQSFGAGDHDVWIIKLDSLGNLMWQKTFGDEQSQSARSITQTDDNGYLIAAATNNFSGGNDNADLWLIKINEYGDSLWTKNIGGSDRDRPSEIIKLSTGGYAVVGQTDSYGAGGDSWIVKINPSGEIVWEKNYGGNLLDHTYSVAETSDGGFILAGETVSNVQNPRDIWVFKTDSLGQIIWIKTYDHQTHIERATHIQTTDGGYIISGTIYLSPYQFWLMKIDSSGNIIWERTYNREKAISVTSTQDGGFIAIGSGVENGGVIKLVKTDSMGNPTFTKSYGEGWGTYIENTRDGGYIISATGNGGLGCWDWIVIKIDKIVTGLQNLPNLVPKMFHLDQNFPNPFNSITTIGFSVKSKDHFELTIYDQAGKQIKLLLNQMKTPGKYTVSWNGKDDNEKVVSSGIYFYRLQGGSGHHITKKAVLLK